MNKHLANIGLTISVAIALAAGAIIADNHASAYECEVGIVTAQPGDTLWSIATTNCNGSTQRAVYDIKALHGTTSLQVGDTITLP